MGLFDSLKNRKKKKDASDGAEAEGLLPLESSEPEGVEPPETRYTPEYQAFLAAQEAAQRGELPAEEGEMPAERGELLLKEEEYPVVSPEGFCARFERCDTSLIEEPETCDVCVFFRDRDDTCRYPEKMQ